jgi:Ca2+-binding RTX toxin-like protein
MAWSRRWTRALVALAVGALVFLVWSLATAGAEPSNIVNFRDKVIRYDAPAGVDNDVTTSWVYDYSRHGWYFVVEDAATPIVAGGNCHQDNPNRVACYVGNNGAPTPTDYHAINLVEIRGNDGNDTIRLPEDTAINSAPGTDLASVQVTTAWGGPGNDVLRGADGGNRLYGEDGDDTLEGGADSWNPDYLYGGPGNDVLRGQGSPETSKDRLEGGPGDDQLLGGSNGALAVFRDRGAIRADLDTGVVTFPGTAERDSIIVGSGVNGVVGSQLDDVILGSSTGNDELSGAGGGDIIDGRGGNDEISGGEPYGREFDGNDRLIGGPGADKLSGGALFQNDRDVVDYSARTNRVRAILSNTGPDDGEEGEGDAIDDSVEDVVGGSGSDIMIGNSLDNVLNGGGGADSLDGGGGDDVLIEGGGDGDALIGGPGADTADYATRGDALNLSLDDVANDGRPGEGDLIDDTVENVRGGNGQDTISGSPTANRLDGGPNRDTVTYAGRTEALALRSSGGVANTDGAAGEGDEIVNAEVLVGGNGNDTLGDWGGTASTLRGGPGTDTADYSQRGDAVGLSADGVANDGGTFEGDDIGTDIEVLKGGGGDDRFTSRPVAAERFIGGAGVDQVDYSARPTGINASNDGVANDGAIGEADQIDADIERLVGGAGDDVLSGRPGQATVFVGNGGNDTVDYRQHTTGVTASLDGAANDGSDGELDLISLDVENISGSTQNDVLSGRAGVANALFGRGGTDLVTYAGRTEALALDPDGVADDGAAGEGDLIGADVERVTGGSGNDTVAGNAQANQLRGGTGVDTVTYAGRTEPLQLTLNGIADDGAAGENDLIGADVENVIGGEGNDTLAGTPSANRLLGGGGVDMATYAGRAQPLVLRINGVADDGALMEGDDLDVENVVGGSGDDVFSGPEPIANAFHGGPGRDTVDYSDRTEDLVVSFDGVANDGFAFGDEEDDVRPDVEAVETGAGDDLIISAPGVGNDIVAGPGFDTVDYSDRSAPLHLSLGAGADDGEAGEGDDLEEDIERVVGGSGNDVFVGSDLDDQLVGGPGDDEFSGGLGNDSFQGDDGADTWHAGGDLGADTFSGGVLRDTVEYAVHLNPVRVTDDGLANDGSSLEHDNVGADVETVRGTEAEDVIVLTMQVDHIVDGLGGDDEIDVRDGINANDTVDGGGGFDVCGRDLDDPVDCDYSLLDAHDDAVTTAEDTTIDVELRANDEGEELSPPVIVTAPARGTATILPDGRLRYVPQATVSGPEQLVYEISDGNGATDRATVTISVTGVDDPPNAVDDSAATDEDVPVSIDVMQNDDDGGDSQDLLVVAVTQPPAFLGSVAIVDGQPVFTPAPDATGTATFTYTLSDGSLTDTATVTVTIRRVADQAVVVRSGDGAAPGHPDRAFTVRGPSTEARPATVLDAPHPAYAVIPGTQWISVSGAGSGSEGSATYEAVLDVPAGAIDPVFAIDVHADNAARVFLNDIEVGAQPQSPLTSNFTGLPERFTSSTAVVTGRNRLRIELVDFGDPSGIDVSAAITFDLEGPADVRVGDVTVVEGNGGTTSAVFRLSLSSPRIAPVAVDLLTAPGTATKLTDFTMRSGTVTFAPGEVERTFAVSVKGDTLAEAAETFSLGITALRGAATIGDGTGLATITDDDAPVAVSALDAATLEGDSGQRAMTFTLALAAPAGSPVVVNVATSAGTATKLVDYANRAATVTFNPGQTNRTVDVILYGDTVVEPDETINLTITGVVSGPAVIGDGHAVGTIRNDDGITASVADARVTEGSSGAVTMLFTVTLSSPSSGAVEVDLRTSPGTATKLQDFVMHAGTVKFAAGQVTKTFSVTVNGDTTPEPDETLLVDITAVRGNAATGDGHAVGTIADDDAAV